MGIVAVVLLGFALRLWRLASLGDLEFDEIVSARYAALPAGELLPRLAGALFEHPPAFYLALGWWQAVFGHSDVALRLFSVVPGTLTIPLTYAVARRLLDRRTALVAALLVAVAPLPLFYSREARMYALVGCLVLASLWLFLRLAGQVGTGRPAGPPQRWWGRVAQPPIWWAYLLVGALTAYVHYLGALVVAGQLGAAGGAPGWRGRVARTVALAVAGMVVLSLPWLMAAQGTRASLPALQLGHLTDLPEALWLAWGDLAAGPQAGGVLALLAALTLLVLTVAGFPRHAPAGVVIGATLLAGLAGLVFVVALEKPVQARYVLPVTPLLYVCAAAGLRRGRTWWLLGSLGLMLGFGPFWLRYYSGYARADYSEITRRIATLERAQDTVLLTGPWQAWYFDYYYHGQLSHQVLPRDAPPALDPQEARVQLEALSQRYRRLWFVQAGLAQADPSNFVERWLQHHAWPAWRSVHQNAVLTHYALQAPRLTRPLRPVTFGGLVRLEGGWVDAEEVPAGDVVRLTLELSLLEDVPVEYKASLRLVGADGQRTAVDFELLDRTDEAERGTAEWDVGQRVTVRRGIWVPASLGPQPYSVRLVVYDPHTLSPLTPAQAGSEPPAGGPVVPGSELGGDSELGTRNSELRAQRGGEVAIADVYVTQSLAGLPPDAEAAYEPYGWRFGGGDAFDAFELVGARWVQGDPQAAPLAFDLLWRLDGLSGTEHRSTIAVVDERGVVWSEETRALFGGTFAIHDWRQRETLAERRLADLSALPPGRYRVVVALQDARGRTLPVEVSPVGTGAGGNQEGRGASPGAVELRRYELPYRRPLGERIAGLWQRLPLARLFVLGG